MRILPGAIVLLCWLAGPALAGAADSPRDRVEALAGRVARALEDRLHGRVELQAGWDYLDELGWSTSADAGALLLRFRRPGEERPFAVYALAPWQPFFANTPAEDEGPGRGVPAELVGVTADALVFKAFQEVVADRAWLALRGEVAGLVAEAALLPATELESPARLPEELPAGMEVASAGLRGRWLRLVLDLTAGPPPTPEGLARTFRGPWVVDATLRTGRGPARRWLLPPCWAELEPGDARSPDQAPPPAAAAAKEPPPGETFPGYQPKHTPDTVLDFRPGLRPKVEALPPATLAALPALLTSLRDAAAKAAAHPGAWTEGNPILGAAPREWDPSDEELLEAELGRRLAEVVAGAEPAALARALAKAGEHRAELGYRAIEVSHADVMGSGRFFYASPPTPRTLRLRPAEPGPGR